MAAARMRPGFERTDTDNMPMPSSSQKKEEEAYEMRNFNDSKTEGVIEVDPVDAAIPHYDAENDGFGHISQPVETAKDLVTQVLHVDDDPTLNPLTFRVAFLGMCCFSCLTHAIIHGPSPSSPFIHTND